MVTPQFGAPDLFEERVVERPQPGPGEVLVRVVAAGTNPVDAKFRSSGDAMGLEAPIILGSDVSGVVEEVGAGVTDLAPGDEVYYTPEVFGPRSNGGYAGYNVAKADIVAKKPASLSHEEAAVTNGTAMAFTRYSTEGPGNSLYFVEDAAAFPGAIVVASERLDGDEAWREVPDRHLLAVGEGGASVRPLRGPAR
jgi:NADPH2:quinone reductase